MSKVAAPVSFRQASRAGLAPAGISSGSQPALLTPSQFAAAVQLHPDTVTRLVRRKELHGVWIGGALRIPTWVLDDFCARPREVPVPLPRSQTTWDPDWERKWEAKYGVTATTRGAGHVNGTKQKRGKSSMGARNGSLSER